MLCGLPSTLCLTGELWPLRFIWHHDLRVTHCQSSARTFVLTQSSFCNSFRHGLLRSFYDGLCLKDKAVVFVPSVSNYFLRCQGGLNKYISYIFQKKLFKRLVCQIQKNKHFCKKKRVWSQPGGDKKAWCTYEAVKVVGPVPVPCSSVILHNQIYQIVINIWLDQTNLGLNCKKISLNKYFFPNSKRVIWKTMIFCQLQQPPLL